MKKDIVIEVLQKEQMDSIKPLWEALNEHHEAKSIHFKKRFQNFSFENRKEALLNKEKLYILTAKDKEKLIGYCISAKTDQEGEIESLYVEPEYRKSGIGKQFMRDSIYWLEKENVDEIFIKVAAGNEQVVDFYRNYGFEISTLKLKMIIDQRSIL